MARLKRQALDLVGEKEKSTGDRMALEVAFERAVRMTWIAYQPIVYWPRREVYGHEALLRSNDPILTTPAALFDAARQLGRVHDLGRLVRKAVTETQHGAPSEGLLFVNVHPLELGDDTLYRDDTPLALMSTRVILEITERESLLSVERLGERIDILRKLGYRIAIDDLGAGYAGLASFAQLEPDIVKLDMALVRNIHREATKRKLVRSMISVFKDMAIMVIAEGVETVSERDALVDMGCEFLQGYLFAKPASPVPRPRW